MGKAIVRVQDEPPLFVIWSTVVDSPITWVMTRDELTEHIREQEGLSGLEALLGRMRRVEEKGTSFLRYASRDSLLVCNRAGPDESELGSWEEIAERFQKPPDTETS